MDFDVYCDEALPDLFTTKKPRAQYLMIGSLWLPSEYRNDLKEKIKKIREDYNTFSEIKWTKVSPNRLEFYESLIDLFFSYGTELRFRCIAVDHTKVNMDYHNGDRELGFYKFYYQLLQHWIKGFNSYSIFCDTKTNRDPQRLQVLKRVLNNANLYSEIKNVQSLPSKEVALIQFCDLLLGAASSRLNNTLAEGSGKEAVVNKIEKHLGIEKISPTSQAAKKYNVFKIRLEGGW